MDETHLRYFCPNRLIEGNPNYECRGGRIGGPSLETLNSHDFGKSPFVDIRYCQKCRVYIRITIVDMATPPHFEILSVEEYKKQQYVTVDKLFGGFTVEGRHKRVFTQGDSHE